MSAPPPRSARRWSGWPAPTRSIRSCGANLLQDIHIALWRSLGTIIVALTVVIVVLLRRIYVYRLQKQIDELDRLRGAGAIPP